MDGVLKWMRRIVKHPQQCRRSHVFNTMNNYCTSEEIMIFYFVINKINCLSLDLSQVYFDFKANDYFGGKFLKLPVVMRKTYELTIFVWRILMIDYWCLPYVDHYLTFWIIFIKWLNIEMSFDEMTLDEMTWW